jgi:hypothetical protein
MMTKDQAVIEAYTRVAQAKAHLSAVIATPDPREEEDMTPTDCRLTGGNEENFGGSPRTEEAPDAGDGGPLPAAFSDEVEARVEKADGYLVGLTFFRDRDEAVAHASVEAFEKWYNKNRISFVDRPRAIDVLGWLRENRHVVRSILSVLA